MSKTDAFSEFQPSYASVGAGWLPDLFEEAFRDAQPKIIGRLGQADQKIFTADGVVGAGKDRPFRFGHVRATNPIGDELSGAAPYLLTVEFKGDELKEVVLKLSLLNPRMVVANELFTPADFNKAGPPANRFDTLTASPAPCGFALVYEPDAISPADRFLKLTDAITDDALQNSNPVGFLPFTQETLVGRFDLSISWKSDQLGKISRNLFGQAIGTPDASLVDGVNTIQLFSRSVAKPFDSLLSASLGFALELPHNVLNGLQIVAGDPKTLRPGASDMFAKARRAFNLSDKFAGILFEGVRVHWLDDKRCSSSDWPNGGVGLTAVALGGKDEKLGNWYTTFQAQMQAEPGKRYLGMFSRIAINATLADRDVRQLQLKSRFDKLDPPFSWLAERDAVLSFTWDTWKDRAGNSQDGRSIGLSLEATTGDVLMRLNAKELGVSDAEFNSVATAMTLAPIVLTKPPEAAEQDNTAPDGKRRGYFSVIRNEQTIPQLFAGAAAGWIFEECVKVKELRVVGVALQVQPARINDPTSAEDARETALLLDYETEFTVSIDAPEIETERTVSARVDGTGVRIGGGDVSWVQVPGGLHDLSLADPGLWKLGALGKILKVVELSLRHDPAKHLAIRLHLTGDLGILTADDFVITIDLVSGQPKIEAFPSQVVVEKPGTFKATGKLYLDKTAGSDRIRGSLDVVLSKIGWRAYAGLRIMHIDDGFGGKAKASIASLMLEWPTMIPVLSTGIGVKSVAGLLATHFMRKLPPTSASVPADLAWLKAAKGDVVRSIEEKDLWSPMLGASTVGLGLGLGAMSSPKLANFNAMLAIEEPGPQILIFGKLNLFKDPKPNDKEPEALGDGILGLLKIDTVQSRITFAALADLEFSQFLHLRAPIEISAGWKQLAAWHIYLGHFNDPITATLKLGSIASLTAKAWLMAAGDEIRDAPNGPGAVRTLPGLALSTGVRVHLQIGPDWLCVRGDLASHLNASISHLLYASGGLQIGGELRLWIVSVGASGTFRAEYLTSDSPRYSAIFASGEICGKYETFLFSISGCVRVSVGAAIADPTSPPALVGSGRIVAGASVALHGQGQIGPIDAVLGDATADPAKAPPDTPLDAVIALNMESPPRVAANGTNFVERIIRPFENARFHLGAVEGHYLLKSVSLERESTPGNWQAVDYPKCPATWWQPHGASTGGQPMPTTLALLTRAPLAASNALPSPDQLKAWLTALLGDNICDPSVPAQRCMYMLVEQDRGAAPAGRWSLRAELPTSEIERRIGRAGATASDLTIDRRPHAGDPGDPLPGYPAYPATCLVAPDPMTGLAVSYLRLQARLVRTSWLSSSARIAGPMLRADPMLIMLAHFSSVAGQVPRIVIRTRDAGLIYTSLDKLPLANLADAGVQAGLHEGHPRWQPRVEAFARLAGDARYRGHEFVVATLDFQALGVSATDQVESVAVGLSNEVGQQLGRRLTMSVLVGGYRFTPVAEQVRHDNDEATRTGIVSGLNAYLKGDPIPLLEPDSLYRVAAEWDAVTGASVPGRTELYFRTTGQPPRTGQSYVLATFPQDGEKFHFAHEHPGFSLGSVDALRILAKFPKVRVRVTISEDNGAPVTDSAGKLEWHKGISFKPSEIADALKPPPAGLLTESISALPTALREALVRLTEEQGLGCLGPIDMPPGGLWIGFDAVLRTLSSYRIVVELVDEAGARIFADDENFLSWRFKTGLNPNLSAHAQVLRDTPMHHRALKAPLGVLPAMTTTRGLRVVADKILEDAIAVSTGDRNLLRNEAQISILWQPMGNVLRAVAILISSNEPLMRATKGVQEEEFVASNTTVRVLVPGDQLVLLPNLGASARIDRFEVASSGCVIIAHLNPTSVGEAQIALERIAVERIPSGSPVVETIVVSAASLADRPKLQ